MKLYKYSIKRTFVKDVNSTSVSYPDLAANAARALIDFEREQEQLIVLLLNGRNKIKGSFLSSIGTLDAALVHPREVFKPAILASASAVILVHNHPSDDCSPSEADKEVMKRLSEAGKIIGIKLLDSIIVTETETFSFKEKGLL